MFHSVPELAMRILVALEFFSVDLHTLVEFLAILFPPCLACAEPAIVRSYFYFLLLSILYRFFSLSVLVRLAIVQWDACFLLLHTAMTHECLRSRPSQSVLFHSECFLKGCDDT